MRIIPLVLTLAIAGSAWSAQRRERTADASTRTRPPRNLPCSRDELTSFTGSVVSYERTPTRIRLRIKTDWDTDERFELELSPQEGTLRGLLLEGKPLRPSDWVIIEAGPGKLKPEMRATVWVCEGIANPVIDWRPSPKSPEGKPQEPQR